MADAVVRRQQRRHVLRDCGPRQRSALGAARASSVSAHGLLTRRIRFRRISSSNGTAIRATSEPVAPLDRTYAVMSTTVPVLLGMADVRAGRRRSRLVRTLGGAFAVGGDWLWPPAHGRAVRLPADDVVQSFASTGVASDLSHCCRGVAGALPQRARTRCAWETCAVRLGVLAERPAPFSRSTECSAPVWRQASDRVI